MNNQSKSVFGGQNLTDDQITGLQESDFQNLSSNQINNLTEDQKSSMVDRFGQDWQSQVTNSQTTGQGTETA